MTDRDSRAMCALYRTDFRAFLQVAFRILHPHRVLTWHWILDLFSDAVRQTMFTGEYNTLLAVPPRTLKSFVTSVALPAWLHGKDPRRAILCLAESDRVALAHRDRFSALISSDKYLSIFSRRGGPSASVLAAGEGCDHLTFGGTLPKASPDAVIIDDPHAFKDEPDTGLLASHRRWFEGRVLGEVSSSCRILAVMSRVALGDLTDAVREHAGWRAAEVPVLAREDEPRASFLGHGPGRTRGDELNPGGMPRAALREKLREIGARRFMARYQQQPYEPGNGRERGGALRMVITGWHGKRCYSNAPAFGVIPEERALDLELFGEGSQGPALELEPPIPLEMLGEPLPDPDADRANRQVLFGP
ncbi:MAG: hypothetical protein AAGJ54_03960 [Planctomycetota bacterium]